MDSSQIQSFKVACDESYGAVAGLATPRTRTAELARAIIGTVSTALADSARCTCLSRPPRS